MKISFSYWVNRALSTSVIVTALAFSANAHAALLQINSGISQVTYTPGGLCSSVDPTTGRNTCPTPQTAALSGQIELNVSHEHWESGTHVTDRDILSLTTIGFSAGLLSSNSPLAGAVAIISGENFEIRDDPCFLAPFPEMCSEISIFFAHWGSDGTWDGHSLSWTGYSYEVYGDGLTYTINAEIVPQTSTVSEPISLSLFGLAMLGLGVGQRRCS